METIENLVREEIYHADYNLSGKYNLNNIPNESAVFGVFGIVDDEPINCRFVGETENLKEAISDLFTSAPSIGMETFMQGPWIKMLVYDLVPDLDKNQRAEIARTWENIYKPNIDDDGDYPGYYDS